jgi:WD40 repeat protein
VVQLIAYSPDGLALVSAALNQSIRLWEAQTGQCLKTVQSGNLLRALRTYSWVSAVAFSSDGSLLASSGIDQVVGL